MKGKIFMYRRMDDAVTFTEIDGGFVKDYRSEKFGISTIINARVMYTAINCCKAIPYDGEHMIIDAIIKQNFDCDFTEKIVPILVNKILNLESQFKSIQMPEPVKTELGKEYCIELAKCMATAIMLHVAVTNKAFGAIDKLEDKLEPLSCMSASFTNGAFENFPITLNGLRCMEIAYVLTESDYCPVRIPISEKSARVLKSTGQTLLKKYVEGIEDGSIEFTDEYLSDIVNDFSIVLHIFRELPLMIKEFDVRYAWLDDINRRCLEQEILPTDIDDTEAYKMLYSNISKFNIDGDFSDILKQISSFAGYDDDEDDDDVEESEDQENSDDEENEMLDIEEFKRCNRSHKINGKDIAKTLDKIFDNLTSIFGNLTSESEDEEDDDSEDSDEDDVN